MADDDTKSDKKPAEPVERQVTTEHRLHLGGRELDFTATCGTLVLREEAAKDDKREAPKSRATMFYTAYTLAGGDAPMSSRPITFSFNGGPGSSSVWLHLGVLGPWRVVTDDMGQPPAPPYALEDNEHTLLTHSDLVFIDPVGTGHSRMAEGEKVAEYHEYQRDLDAMGEFIRLWLTRHGRWASPKYVIGESYGTTRAAGLSHHLQGKHDIFLNGVMLVSLAIDFQTLCFDPGNELPYPLFVPTYAATAWYHRALHKSLLARPVADVIADAEAFANGDYTVALMQGSRLPEAERKRIATQLARWTGLSAEYVLQADLRPTPPRYFKQLLRDRGLVVGRLDSRFTGLDRDDAGEAPEDDPSISGLVGAYATGIHTLLRGRLNWTEEAPYLVLAPLWNQWKWKEFENRYVNVAESLRKAMHANPHMRVYVASGWYDLGTPHAAGDWTIAHLGLREALRGNLRCSYFEAGHMMYIHAPSLQRMGAELREFVEGNAT